MLLGGYSRCALGDLARNLDVRPKTAESGLEPEDRVGILALQLERALSQERTSSPSRMTGRAYARHPGSTSVDVDVMLIIFQLVGGVQKRCRESQWFVFVFVFVCAHDSRYACGGTATAGTTFPGRDPEYTRVTAEETRCRIAY